MAVLGLERSLRPLRYLRGDVRAPGGISGGVGIGAGRIGGVRGVGGCSTPGSSVSSAANASDVEVVRNFCERFQYIQHKQKKQTIPPIIYIYGIYIYEVSA